MKPLHSARHPLKCFASSTGNFGFIVVQMFGKKKKCPYLHSSFYCFVPMSASEFDLFQHGLMQLMSKIGLHALRSPMIVLKSVYVTLCGTPAGGAG